MLVALCTNPTWIQNWLQKLQNFCGLAGRAGPLKYFYEYLYRGRKSICKYTHVHERMTSVDPKPDTSLRRGQAKARSCAKHKNRGWSRSIPQPSARLLDRSVDRLLDHSLASSLNCSVETSFDRSLARSFNRSGNRPIAQSLDATLDRSLDRSTDRSTDRPTAWTESHLKNSTLRMLDNEPPWSARSRHQRSSKQRRAQSEQHSRHPISTPRPYKGGQDSYHNQALGDPALSIAPPLHVA